jgi:hypothetical protein
VLNIYRSRLDIGFKRYIKSSSGKVDSLQALSAPFYSGKEVLQTNRFDNRGLKELAENGEFTYIKTPAGLFTEVTLPIMEAIETNDTINTAKIYFTRYNEESANSSQPHPTLLMVRKSEMHRFFLKNELTNGKTSYLTTFTSNKNRYQFSNISNLLKHCYAEYSEGISSDPDWETKNPDWNKVVLIPVKTTEDSNGNVVKITHDTSIRSIRLRGGDEYRIAIEIISSKFND